MFGTAFIAESMELSPDCLCWPLIWPDLADEPTTREIS